MTIRVVTDSTSDVDAKWLDAYNIRVVPAFIQFGDESFADDGEEMPPAEFYRRLAASETLPTTSAPSVGLTEQVLREALDEAEHVISISLSANISGINNVMNLAAQNIDPDRITVIDGGMLSMGTGWVVIAAAEAAAAGASLKDVLDVVHDTIQRTEIYAAFDTFEYLRRGGRVSSVAASIGRLLQIKPILHVKDGNVDPVARVRTYKKLYPELESMVRKHTSEKPLERLAFLHTNAPEKLDPLKAALKDVTPDEWVITTEATSAIGAQVGPKAIGVAFVKAK
jgi:DegV family protein with EDD domain